MTIINEEDVVIDAVEELLERSNIAIGRKDCICQNNSGNRHLAQNLMCISCIKVVIGMDSHFREFRSILE